MTSAPRDIDNGRYRLLEPIGRGGYGSVFRAVQTSIDRFVALKLVHPHLETRDDVAERFRREARLTSRLRHPSAVRVIDFGVDDGALFLVMEYVDGCTLKELISRESRISHDRIRHITRGIAGALGAAHEIGLVHRDLKPSNVLVTPDGDPVVIDFGLVKVFSGDDDGSSVTRSDVMIGTPSYLSPEAVVGQPLDGRADLYALGILLYELLTGRRPFEGASALEVATARLHEDPEPLPPTVPRDLRITCERLLERHPADRPPSASWVIDALAPSAAAEPRPPTPETVALAMDATTAPARGPAAYAQLRSMSLEATPRGGEPLPVESALTPRLASTSQPTRRSRVGRVGLVAAAVGIAAALGVFAFVRAEGPSPGEGAVSGAPEGAVPGSPHPTVPAPVTGEGSRAEYDAAPGPPHPPAPAPEESPLALPFDALDEGGRPEPASPVPETASTASVSPVESSEARTEPGEPTAPLSSEAATREERAPQIALASTNREARTTPESEEEVAGSLEPASQLATSGSPLPTRTPERPPERESARTRDEARQGYLTINIEPWGTVSIDGEDHGEAPLRSVALPEGVHEVRSTYRGQVRTERVRVRHGESITLTHRFAR